MAILFRNAAKRAARQRRTNNRAAAEAEDSAGGVIHKAQPSRVPAVESRQPFRFSREVTGLYIARTVSPQGREPTAAAAAAVVEIAGMAVIR